MNETISKQLSILYIKKGHFWDQQYYCPSQRILCLIENQLNGAKKNMNHILKFFFTELVVHFIEVSVKRELTVKLKLKLLFHFRYEIPESSEGSLLEFDDVLKSVGEFGSWQKALFFLTCTFVIIPTAFQITSVIFVSGTPKFQCTTPDMKCDVDKCCKNCTKYEFIQHYTTISTEVRTLV